MLNINKVIQSIKIKILEFNVLIKISHLQQHSCLRSNIDQPSHQSASPRQKLQRQWRTNMDQSNLWWCNSFVYRRSWKISPQKIRTSSLSPTASSCKKPTVDSTSQAHASGIMKSMELSLSSGTHHHSSASLMYSDVPFDCLCSHSILNTFITDPDSNKCRLNFKNCKLAKI